MNERVWQKNQKSYKKPYKSKLDKKHSAKLRENIKDFISKSDKEMNFDDISQYFIGLPVYATLIPECIKIFLSHISPDINVIIFMR